MARHSDARGSASVHGKSPTVTPAACRWKPIRTQLVKLGESFGVPYWRTKPIWQAVGMAGLNPGQRNTFAPGGGLYPWVRLLIWLGLITAWTGGSHFCRARPRRVSGRRPSPEVVYWSPDHGSVVSSSTKS
jgi:hypothetical protein